MYLLKAMILYLQFQSSTWKFSLIFSLSTFVAFLSDAGRCGFEHPQHIFLLIYHPYI